jgi:hypothetical protein
MAGQGGWLIFALVCCTGAALLAGEFVLAAWAEHDAAVHPLVVLADDGVALRRGNAFAYPPRYETPLNRGVEARLLFMRGDWLQIELAGGEVGWVPARAALVDVAAQTRTRMAPIRGAPPPESRPN